MIQLVGVPEDKHQVKTKPVNDNGKEVKGQSSRVKVQGLTHVDIVILL